MHDFRDSKSPALTPSLRDERSKVVSMAVTLGGSGVEKCIHARTCVCVYVCYRLSFSW